MAIIQPSLHKWRLVIWEKTAWNQFSISFSSLPCPKTESFMVHSLSPSLTQEKAYCFVHSPKVSITQLNKYLLFSCQILLSTTAENIRCLGSPIHWLQEPSYIPRSTPVHTRTSKRWGKNVTPGTCFTNQKYQTYHLMRKWGNFFNVILFHLKSKQYTESQWG